LGERVSTTSGEKRFDANNTSDITFAALTLCLGVHCARFFLNPNVLSALFLFEDFIEADSSCWLEVLATLVLVVVKSNTILLEGVLAMACTSAFSSPYSF
jgi:hypothetical protein